MSLQGNAVPRPHAARGCLQDSEDDEAVQVAVGGWGGRVSLGRGDRDFRAAGTVCLHGGDAQRRVTHTGSVRLHAHTRTGLKL